MHTADAQAAITANGIFASRSTAMIPRSNLHGARPCTITGERCGAERSLENWNVFGGMMDWRDKARRMYEQDKLSLKKISKKLGKHHNRISMELKEMGVEIRDPWNASKETLKVRWDDVQRMYEYEGCTVAECAQYAGCSASYCGNKLRSMGTKMRDAKESRPANTVQVWLRSRRITQARIAQQAQVAQSYVSHHLKSKMFYQEVQNALEELGVPEHLLNPERAEKPKPERETKYWNPWASGDIRGPYGVESNSILMCPM